MLRPARRCQCTKKVCPPTWRANVDCHSVSKLQLPATVAAARRSAPRRPIPAAPSSTARGRSSATRRRRTPCPHSHRLPRGWRKSESRKPREPCPLPRAQPQLGILSVYSASMGVSKFAVRLISGPTPTLRHSMRISETTPNGRVSVLCHVLKFTNCPGVRPSTS